MYPLVRSPQGFPRLRGKLSPQVTDEGKAPPSGGAVTRSVTEVGCVLERHPTPLIPLPWRGRNNKKTEETSVFLYFTFSHNFPYPLAGVGAEMGTPAPTREFMEGELFQAFPRLRGKILHFCQRLIIFGAKFSWHLPICTGKC